HRRVQRGWEIAHDEDRAPAALDELRPGARGAARDRSGRLLRLARLALVVPHGEPHDGRLARLVAVHAQAIAAPALGGALLPLAPVAQTEPDARLELAEAVLVVR